jgi:hypothetical protein
MPRLQTEWFLDPNGKMKVRVRGIPHLAKNERDVGHPVICCAKAYLGTLANSTPSFFPRRFHMVLQTQ